MSRRSGSFITNNPSFLTSNTAVSGIWPISEASQAKGTNKWPGITPPSLYAYTISNSLRFRSSASAYLNRTFGTPTSQYVWTFSAWIKRGTLGSSSYQALMATRDTGSAGIWWWGDTLTIANNGAGALVAQSTAVFRDPSAWYHVVVKSNGTTIVGYVNNQQVLSYTGTIGRFNTAVVHNIANDTQSSYYFDGYMAEINFIDGQALTPSSFGETNSTTGTWVPKQYTGAYGTNGFYLNFSNGTSTTTLGYDSSGNGNNWTTNNISLTSGSTYDWMIDSPTPVSSTVGNYAVLNPLSAGRSINSASLQYGGAATGIVKGSIAVSSGKWYWEYQYSGGIDGGLVGIAPSSVSPTITFLGAVGTGTGYGYYSGSGYKYGGSGGVAYGASWTTTDIIGVALDLDAGTITFYKNNVSQGVAFSGLSGEFVAAAGNNTTQDTGIFNFGQRPFAYTPPSGYKSLCTYNLPTPTIQNGANYMAATLYTGNGSTQSITNTVNGVSFAPDFVWIKDRTATDSHRLLNTITAATKFLCSDLTNAEATDATGLTAFTSNGFTLGSDHSYNQSTYAYVAWNWKAGGTAVTNTAGSITSSVSANPTAGFSVVTYTGTGANATVGHGLGVAPSMVIIKRRNAVADWVVYHSAIGNTGAVFLDLTNAIGTSIYYWNNTSPTSTTVSLGIAGGVNNSSSDTYVAYCFAAIAGYSAFGSYTGNGSSDGPFVYCGFRPRFILIKGSSFVSNWFIEDSARNGYNVNDGVALRPNLTNAEDGTTTYNLDITSNGFKLRSSATDSNTNGATFVWAAFAENPFNYSLAR